MEQHGVRRLPVVQDGRLVGIVTRGDLRAAQPSHATTLSVYEWRALLSQATVAECMTHNPLAVAPIAVRLASKGAMMSRTFTGAVPSGVPSDLHSSEPAMKKAYKIGGWFGGGSPPPSLLPTPSLCSTPECRAV
jgi:CBS domain-containing protein